MKIIAEREISKDVSNIKEYIGNISHQISYLQSVIDTIPKYWTGADAKKFIKKYNEEAIPQLKKFEKEFNNYVSFLSKIYKIYSALEENYNKNINTE